eukprot:TRINITY_DN263_c9_g1_i1.p1 TRINITY_DN263_c9_g1~~TRINITY_DN263_c9_g1_i1.p1  ORF type:complete len:535 (+),score=111.43 TRINITY_DN263_c9_g1_i1:468-2072(+)
MFTVLLLVILVPLILFLYVFFLHDFAKGPDVRLKRTPYKGFIGNARVFDPENHYQNAYELFRVHADKSQKMLVGNIFDMSPIVFYADPDILERVLTDPIFADKPPRGYDPLKIFLGKFGLVSSNGEVWAMQRKIVSHVFTRPNMKLFVDSMCDSTMTLVGKWNNHIESDTATGVITPTSVDVDDDAMLLTLDIITRAMFTRGFDVQTKGLKNAPFIDAMMKCLHECAVRMFSPFRKLNLYAQWELKKASEVMKAGFEDIVQQHRDELKEEGGGGGGGGDRTKTKDMIRLMLEARDEDGGGALTDQMIIDQCKTFLFAGHDTTAHTLAWAFFLISTHPEVERKILQELNEIVGGHNDGDDVDVNDLYVCQHPPELFKHEDIGKMRYLGQVIKETLRMYPPVPAYGRLVAEDTEINGYFIPKGVTFSVLIRGIHYDESIYPDPHRFDPDRFSEEACAARHKYAWVPFSGRGRACIGLHFAQMELKTILAMLVPRFSFRHDRSRRVGMMSNITQLPYNGLWLFVRHRLGEKGKSTCC